MKERESGRLQCFVVANADVVDVVRQGVTIPIYRHLQTKLYFKFIWNLK